MTSGVHNGASSSDILRRCVAPTAVPSQPAACHRRLAAHPFSSDISTLPFLHPSPPLSSPALPGIPSPLPSLTPILPDSGKFRPSSPPTPWTGAALKGHGLGEERPRFGDMSALPEQRRVASFQKATTGASLHQSDWAGPAVQATSPDRNTKGHGNAVAHTSH